MNLQKIKYDFSLIKFMSLFETITNAKLKDCFIDELKQTIFVVEEGQIGKAIGHKGNNVKRIENILKRKIKIIEFNKELIQFVKNMVYPIQIKEIREENNIITITPADSKSRGYLIGRGAINLRNYEKIVKRYFDIKEIKVV